ncbi:MAG: OmpH family outer membrane protein [Pseudomonadota bacterium]
MKNQIIAIAGAMALTIAGFSAGSLIPSAEAQSAGNAPVILTISRAQLIEQSKAGKGIPDKAEKVRDSVQKELEGEASKLTKEIEDFQKNSSLMSEEVRQQKQQELAMRQQYGLPQQAQIMEQAFTVAVQQAQAKILVESQPIIADIIKKRGATIVLDKASVMYAATDTDITQEVLSALDKKLDEVEVEKVSLSEIMKRLEDMQKEQQAAANRN